MKVSILVNGRFHFYDLARQLNILNHDVKLISTLPVKYIKQRTNLKSKNINSFLSLELLKRIVDKLKLGNIKFDIFQKKLFAYFSFYNLDLSSDVIIFFAGNGWFSTKLRVVKDAFLIIADEGSAHPNTVNRLLDDEYSRIGHHRDSFSRFTLDEETNNQYQIADYVVVPSTFVKNSLITNGVAETKIFVNPYGVDTKIFFPSRTPVTCSKFRIMFCGLFSIQKGSHVFLDIASHFEKNSDFEFIHVGGIDREMRKILSRYTPSNFVHYEPVKQDELPNFYNMSDIFILPSIQDGFAMVVLQAMACGLPVICSKNSCGPDIIDHGDNGYLVDSNDFDSYIKYIELLYNNRNVLYESKDKIRNKVVNNFTWELYSERYSIFLNSCVKFR